MFWNPKDIELLGFDSVDDFVDDFLSKHENCYVMPDQNGVYIGYDLDTNMGHPNMGCIHVGDGNDVERENNE